MRSKSRAKRSNTELNPLIGDFINTICQKQTSSVQCFRSHGREPVGTLCKPLAGPIFLLTTGAGVAFELDDNLFDLAGELVRHFRIIVFDYRCAGVFAKVHRLVE
jgi:hypothetical protein